MATPDRYSDHNLCGNMRVPGYIDQRILEDGGGHFASDMQFSIWPLAKPPEKAVIVITVSPRAFFFAILRA